MVHDADRRLGSRQQGRLVACDAQKQHAHGACCTNSATRTTAGPTRGGLNARKRTRLPEQSRAGRPGAIYHARTLPPLPAGCLALLHRRPFLHHSRKAGRRRKL